MDRVISKEFEIFCGKDIESEDWLWCNKCHRCYKAFEFRALKDKRRIFLLCHYMDCNGDLPLDSRTWTKLIVEHPGLPQNPCKGKPYDLNHVVSK